jgi:hypothetical protein
MRTYQIAVKIKPLYLKHDTYYLTYNTTRVVHQHYIFMLIRTKNLNSITGTFTGTSYSHWGVTIQNLFVW